MYKLIICQIIDTRIWQITLRGTCLSLMLQQVPLHQKPQDCFLFFTICDCIFMNYQSWWIPPRFNLVSVVFTCNAWPSAVAPGVPILFTVTWHMIICNSELYLTMILTPNIKVKKCCVGFQGFADFNRSNISNSVIWLCCQWSYFQKKYLGIYLTTKIQFSDCSVVFQ